MRIHSTSQRRGFDSIRCARMDSIRLTKVRASAASSSVCDDDDDRSIDDCDDACDDDDVRGYRERPGNRGTHRVVDDGAKKRAPQRRECSRSLARTTTIGVVGGGGGVVGGDAWWWRTRGGEARGGTTGRGWRIDEVVWGLAGGVGWVGAPTRRGSRGDEEGRRRRDGGDVRGDGA